ncbi:hypothetical protein GCM10028857_00420 [Salinarchaeum chitinilyticum]
MSEDEPPIYEPADVVYGADPFKRGTAGRPWVVLSNHEGRPFHGQQYLSLALTTRTWMEGLVELEEGDWVRGGTPSESRIVPWGVQSIGREDIEYWQGRLDDTVVREAARVLVTELESAV